MLKESTLPNQLTWPCLGWMEKFCNHILVMFFGNVIVMTSLNLCHN